MDLIQKLYLSVWTLFIIISCSTEPDTVDEIRTADLPEIKLNRLFTLDEPEDHFFEMITAIETDSQQRIFMVDQRANKVYVFDRDGEFITTFGRRGSGPDDFNGILRIQVDEQDRLIFYDRINIRNVVYKEDDEVWSPVQFFQIEGTMFGVEAVGDGGNVIVRQSKNQRPDRGIYWYVHELAVAHLDSGITSEKRVEFKEMGFLVTDTDSMSRIPFGRTTLLATGSDGKYYMLWNESFDVEIYDMNLNLIDSVSANIPNVAVTQEERAKALDRAGPVFRSLAAEHMPDTKPIAASMKVDPEGNFWMQTFDTPEYIVLNEDGEPIGSFGLSGENEKILHVSHDRVYTVTSGEEIYEITVYEYSLN